MKFKLLAICLIAACVSCKPETKSKVSQVTTSSPLHQWEYMGRVGGTISPGLYRLKVPNGWLIISGRTDSSSVTFYPDKLHNWK